MALGIVGELVEIPKAVSIWSSDGNHAGFMLLAPNAAEDGGECVFMLSPVSCAGIDSEMGIIVSELRESGEHSFLLVHEGEVWKIIVSPQGLPIVVFETNDAFVGNVFTEIGGGVRKVGSIEPCGTNA